MYQVIRTLDIIGGDITRSIQTKNINTMYYDFEKLRNNINDWLYQIGKQYSDTYKTINNGYSISNTKLDVIMVWKTFNYFILWIYNRTNSRVSFRLI